MSEIIVTTTADSGSGSLRQAIANATSGDVILFDPTVFPAGHTTTIALSSYLYIVKTLAIHAGVSDGAGGYTSGASITRYVKRKINGVETEVDVDSDRPEQEGETVLFHVAPRVSLDGQAAQDPDAEDEWSGWTGSRIFNCPAPQAFTLVVSGLGFRNALSDATRTGAFIAAHPNTADVANWSFIDCSFVGAVNVGSGAGGVAGMVSTRNGATLSFKQCEFRDGKAAQGGAIFSSDTSSFDFCDCSFSDCVTTAYGGVASFSGSSQNTLTNCSIKDNSSGSGGAFYFGTSSQNTLTNCAIRDNTATTYGGGVYVISSSQCALKGCTFGGNRVEDARYQDRRDVFFNQTSAATISDSTFDALYVYGTAIVTITGGVSTVAQLTLKTGSVVSFDNGAALCATGTATVETATLTSATRGWLRVPYETDVSQATFKNVCVQFTGAPQNWRLRAWDIKPWKSQNFTVSSWADKEKTT